MLMLLTNIIPFCDVLEKFVDISKLLFVEKRRKENRVLQLSGYD